MVAVVNVLVCVVREGGVVLVLLCVELSVEVGVNVSEVVTGVVVVGVQKVVLVGDWVVDVIESVNVELVFVGVLNVDMGEVVCVVD